MSIGGIMVLMCFGAIFYALYKIDQQKHSGIQNIKFMSFFNKSVTLEDIIEKYEKKPLKTVPDEWSVPKIIMDHFTNYC